MINIIGLGYIGLPTALMFASRGQEVIGTDCDESVVSSLRAGCVTFEEDGLEDLFSTAVDCGIRFETEYQKAQTYIVSVPTPYDRDTKKVDATYVCKAVEAVLRVCPDGADVVIESTVSPGTIDKYVRPLVEGRKVNLVHAPERIIPGNTVRELIDNSRTVGADDPEVAERVKYLYECFCEGIIATTDIRTAELTKVVENTYRDVNIAFANELSRICREADLDVYEVIRIANMHPRVNILQPGPGVGGHCISVDPWFLVGDFPGSVDVIHAARRVNDGQPAWVLSRIREVMVENGIGDFSRVGFYGLTYKEDIDDVRESPTLQLLAVMSQDERSAVKVYDPYVEPGFVEGQLPTLDEFLSAIDMVVILVGHREARDRTADFAGKVVYDTRCIETISGAYSL